MLGTSRMLANGLRTMRAPGPAMAVVLPRAWSRTADRPIYTPGIAQIRCSNQQVPGTLASSTHVAILTRHATEEKRVLRAVNCWLESKRAAASYGNTALQLPPPTVLQSPQGSGPSLLCAQAATSTQSAPPSQEHICSAPILTAEADAWKGQLWAPFDPSFQLQPLLLSSPTTSAMPAARLFSKACSPLQPLRALPPNVRTLTAAPRPPRVPTTRTAPASPHHDHSAHASSSSSSDSRSSSSRIEKVAHRPRSDSRCEELQHALELECGSQYRLKASQLTAGLERALASRPRIVMRERVAELRNAVGLEVAAAMVHSSPFVLLYVTPSDMQDRLDALGDAFDAEPDRIMAMVSRTPCAAGVLHHAGDSAKAKVATLCAVLRVDRKELLDICTKNMRVFKADHRGMALRLATLGDVLGVTPEQVIDMCKRCNRCITADPSNAAEVCRVVAAALEVERSEAAQLCFNNPSLLTHPPAKVAEVARWLKQHLGLTCWDLDRYLVRFGSLPHQFCMLCCVFGCSLSVATSCLPSTQGFILSITTRLLDVLAIPACSTIHALAATLLHRLQRLLVLGAAHGGAPHHTWPSLHDPPVPMPQFLLNANPSELTPRLEALPAALGITPEEGLRLVTEVPRLLLLPTAAMAASWRELQRVAGMRAEWREQLGGWAASSFTRCVHRGHHCMLPWVHRCMLFAHWGHRCMLPSGLRLDAVRSLWPPLHAVPLPCCCAEWNQLSGNDRSTCVPTVVDWVSAGMGRACAGLQGPPMGRHLAGRVATGGAARATCGAPSGRAGGHRRGCKGQLRGATRQGGRAVATVVSRASQLHLAAWDAALGP
jgi:hypothetical protein